MASLTIEVSRRGNNIVESFENIVQNDSIGSRIKRLSIIGLSGGQTARAMRCFPTSMALLESLRIKPVYSTPEDLVSSRVLSVLSAVLMDAGESLRRLELSRCALDWKLNLPSHITHLKLHAIPSNARPTSAQFMNALGQLSNLESLDLVNAFPIYEKEDKSYSRDCINFGHLKKLNIYSSNAEIVAFLSLVTFSPRAAVEVCSQYDTSNATRDAIVDFSTLFTALAQSYAHSASQSLFRTFVARGESIRCAPALNLRLGLFSTDAFAESKWSSDDSQYTPRLSILLKWSRDTLPYLQGTSRAISAFHTSGFPLHAVTHVHLLRFLELAPATLASTLGILPAVRCVTAQRKAGNALVYALSMPSGATIPPLSFARLTAIRFHALELRPSSSTRGFSDSVSTKHLRDCLVHRRKSGAEIYTLTLFRCKNLEAADVSELKRVVVDVSWDVEHPACALESGRYM